VINGQPRKGIAQAGRTGWVYILDRPNGKPLIGVEERPVPQEPRQKTAKTQPFPIGDAIVPQMCRAHACERLRKGRLHLRGVLGRPHVIEELWYLPFRRGVAVHPIARRSSGRCTGVKHRIGNGIDRD